MVLGLALGLGNATAQVKDAPKDVLPPPQLVEKPLGTPPTLDAPLTPGAPLGKAGSPAPLSLPDVLISVDRHYPLIRAAEQERQVAQGNVIAALGAFDHVVKSQNYIDGGTFANQRYSLFLEQQTPYHGLSYFFGYRLGLGNYPSYYEDRKTGDGGEFRAGFLLPLARGREIDSFRATVAKANIDRAIAEPSILQARIDIARMGTLSFLTWVATGQRYLIAREILRVAQDRDAALAKRIAAGNLAPIEREDNRRIVIDRQARLVVAQRALEQAAILLSLYYRNEAGCPVVPTFDQLPAFVEPQPPPDAERRQQDLELAIARRPEIQRLLLQRQKLQVDVDLAENQLLPGLNLGVVGAQDVGQTKKNLYRSFASVALLFDVPLERRNARGRILATQAEMVRVMAQEQMARDRVQAEVQNALNGLDRAHDLLRRGRDTKLQNRYLEDAERRQFDVGKSDLFRVNIRELNTAEAQVLEIDAIAEFYRALTEYLAALGIDTTRGGK